MSREPTQQELDQLHVRNWQQLQKTFNSKGWKEIILPLLDKMITDVVGKKLEDGSWDSGTFGDKRLGEVKADRLLWYRQFGIDFNNRLLSFKKVHDRAMKRQAGPEPKGDTNPMYDSAYAVKGDQDA